MNEMKKETMEEKRSQEKIERKKVTGTTKDNNMHEE
jgi:hypothetical protein